jgi:hypothetical protein
LDGELCGGLALEAIVGYRLTGPNRKAKGSAREPFLGAVNGAEVVPQLSNHGVIGLLLGERLGGIEHVPGLVRRGPVALTLGEQLAQLPLRALPLSVEQLSRPRFVHSGPPLLDVEGWRRRVLSG